MPKIADQTTRVYIGAGDRGVALRASLESIARRQFGGSISKALINAACAHYQIDPETGRLKTGALPTHSPRKK